MEAVEKQYLKTCVFAIYLVSLSRISGVFWSRFSRVSADREWLWCAVGFQDPNEPEKQVSSVLSFLLPKLVLTSNRLTFPS